MCKGAEFKKSVLPPLPVHNEICKIEYFRNENSIKKDVIAQLTQLTKELSQQLKSVCEYAQSWKYYRLMKGKSQPAHVLMVVSVLFVAKLVQSDSGIARRNGAGWMKLLYLACFAAHFGAQFWMTFVSGLTLYFTLPRHTFGSVQKILFPKYFSINAAFSLVTLFTFVKSGAVSDSVLQTTVLVLCFLIELIVRLYISPILVKLMTIKNSMEEQAGVGMEIGTFLPGKLSACPHYVDVHKRFRKVHMAVAIGNMICMGLTTSHLHYLSNKICI